MSATSLNTVVLHALLPRVRAGDREAEGELIRLAEARLRCLTRRMLARFPDVRRWDETDDVLASALLRLGRALRDEAVRPHSTASFYNLSATLIRRELIDLARRHRGPQGLGANHDSANVERLGQAAAADGEGPEELERWARFHEAVERLPEATRDVFRLRLYHGLKPAEAAEVLGVDVQTVRRHLRKAADLLREWLGDDYPTS